MEVPKFVIQNIPSNEKKKKNILLNFSVEFRCYFINSNVVSYFEKPMIAADESDSILEKLCLLLYKWLDSIGIYAYIYGQCKHVFYTFFRKQQKKCKKKKLLWFILTGEINFLFFKFLSVNAVSI